MSDPNLPEGIRQRDIDNSTMTFPSLSAEDGKEIRNVEYVLFRGKLQNTENLLEVEIEERIHISGSQISWLGVHVGEIRHMFEFFERKGKTGDEGAAERLERFLDFIFKEFSFPIKKAVYLTEVQS